MTGQSVRNFISTVFWLVYSAAKENVQTCIS